MKRCFSLLLLPSLSLLLSSTDAHAGPFGRRGNTQQYAAPARPFLATAADAALYMASIGRMGHYGNPSGGYEGVGMSLRSADEAIRNCCFYGRRTIRDQGVAQGANGAWYACCRYW